MNRTVKWYHCIELNPAFCDSDDVKYGNLHKNLKWARTGTIGKGASCCDFRIIDISRCPSFRRTSAVQLGRCCAPRAARLMGNCSDSRPCWTEMRNAATGFPEIKVWMLWHFRKAGAAVPRFACAFKRGTEERNSLKFTAKRSRFIKRKRKHLVNWVSSGPRGRRF